MKIGIYTFAETRLHPETEIRWAPGNVSPIFHHNRFLIQLTVGTMPHDQVLHAIELLGIRR